MKNGAFLVSAIFRELKRFEKRPVKKRISSSGTKPKKRKRRFKKRPVDGNEMVTIAAS